MAILNKNIKARYKVVLKWEGMLINYIDASSPFAIIDFSNLILKYLNSNLCKNQDLVILCIGTDRSTGDSLGPLVGYKLTPIINIYDKVHLMGTLNEPVHAKNLLSYIEKINHTYCNPFILAIDASLGDLDKVGSLNIKKGPLRPGLGVNKRLPAVGELSITGVVNIRSQMDFMILQNTRLNLVMKMAEVISGSINRSLYKLYKTT